MTERIFVSLDARTIFELSQRMIDRGDLEGGLRIAQIAERHEALDERLRNIQSKGDYAAGVAEGLRRAYERSNLPDAERTMPVNMARVISRAEVKIQRIPTGMTAQGLKEKAAKAAQEAAELSTKLGPLAGLKLNLSMVKQENKK